VNLFSERITYLHIIHNDRPVCGGEVTVVNPFDLFNPSQFSDLKVVTFVSSPEFFFERIRGFERVIAILGEEETARQFYQLDPLMEERFVRQAETYPEVLEKLDNGKIELRYMKAGERIHSKIYILTSKDGGFYRVMVGSANFTASAFGDKSQYEELIVYDSNYNRAFCEAYLKRFDELYRNSLDFLSETTRKKIRAILVKAENVFIVTPEERADMTVEKINKENIYGGDATSVVINLVEEREHLEERFMEIERVERIVEHVTKKTRDGHAFEPKERLQSLKDKLREIVSFSHRRSQEFIDKRRFLYFNPGRSEFYIKQEGHAVPYNAGINKDGLRERLLQVSNFVESYWEFAVHKDREVLKRVFEAILYAFTSPFIHIMRKSVRKEKGEEKVAEIPIVLILGGLANTGKTKLLLFINRLLGNTFDVFNYRDIYTKNQRILYDLFYTNNIFPILVDEIYDNFFKGEGERLIKSLTNTLSEPHPCLIGTSNIGFSAESQVIRRIYYLHFGSPFSEDRFIKEKADRYFEERVGIVDDGLFRYFLYEFLKRIPEDRFYTLEDPLSLSRSIFRELFNLAGLPAPDFISERPCGDYYRLGSMEWQALYLTRRSDFREMKDSGEVYYVVDLKSIYEAKDAEQLKNKLPPSVVKSSGTPLILHKKRFLQFIGQREGLLWKFLPRS